MSLLASLFAGTPSPTDDYWYQPVGEATAAGVKVDAESAQKISAWYRGRMILGTVLAMLPFPVYQRLPNDGGSEQATDHPLYDILHDKPNSWQDSFQWRREQVFDIIDCGWAYNWIVSGGRGYVHELHPISPRLVTPTQIKSGPNRGRYVFAVRDEQTGRTTTHTQEEIFYLRGAGGKGILEYARTSLGTAAANESYAAQIFGKGTLNGGYLKVPGVLDEGPARRMALSFVTKPGEHHLPKVLEQGSEFIPNTMTPEDAQMLLSRKFSVDDMARWLGIPRQMLENSDPSFGNAEQFDESFITYSLGGWLSLFEFAVNGQLVLAPKKYYAEFTRDAIARGKLIDRWNVHVAAVNAGIKTVDEARRKEGLNARGGKADELREPQNITGKPTAAVPSGASNVGANVPRDHPQTLAETSDSRARLIAVESAARVLRKEITAVQKAAVKFAADENAFAAWVTEFYVGHAALVLQTLKMAEDEAQAYCWSQAQQILNGAGWLASLETWRTDDYAAGLAALAMEAA